jgi:hypothetical protein
LLAYAIHPARIRGPMLLGRSITLAMIFFGVYGLVTAMWATLPVAVLRYAGQVVVHVLIMVVAIHRLSDRASIGRLLGFTILGTLIATGILFAKGGHSRFYAQQTLGETDPNAVAISLLTGLLCIPPAWLLTRRYVTRAALLAAAPPLAAGVVTTGSRMGLTVLLLTPVLGLILARGAGVVRRLVIPVLGLVVAVGATYFVLESGILVEKAQTRLEGLLEHGVKSELEHNARMWIWSNAIRVFITKPWGFGYGNTAAAMEESAGTHVDIHNNFLAALVEGGVISCLLLLYSVWQLFKHVRRIKSPDLGIPAAFFLVMLVLSSMTLTTLYTKYFWIPFMLCLLLAEQARREELRTAQGRTSGMRPVSTADLLRQLGPADAIVY